MATTQGDLTIVGVSDDGVSYDPICIYGNTIIVDFGTNTVNEEFCLSSAIPTTTTGDLTFQEQTLSYAWTEASTDAAHVIIMAAKTATTIAAKTIYLQVEMNNSLGVNGTQYVMQGIVTALSYDATKGAVNKSMFNFKQTTLPVETIASAV